MAGGESVRKAAEKYGVPKSTLQDRLSSRTAFGARSGPPRYLSDDEEEELVQFLMRSARIGYAKSKKTAPCTCGCHFDAKVGDWWGSHNKGVVGIL